MTDYIAKELRPLARPIDDLELDPENARRHPEENLADIRASLAAHGQQKPIVVRDGVVIAGNGTLQVARDLGWERIACVEYDSGAGSARGNETAKAKAFALADNRSSDRATYDPEQLAATIEELTKEGLLDASGFGDGDLGLALEEAERIANEAEQAGSEQEDPGAEELPEDAQSVRGEIYELGDHLLLCGDSTDEHAVELLLGGEQGHWPDMIFTDPPYGVDFHLNLSSERASKARKKGKIQNDGDEDDAARTLNFAFRACSAKTAFVCCDWRSLSWMKEIMEANGMKPKACIVWSKTGGHQNLDRYAKCHELMLYAGPYGGEATADRDVWECARDFKTPHQTAKPVDLVERAILTASDVGDVVYDPFMGSGTTLIACARNGRVCRGVEIDPGYCDVIRKRWTKWAKLAGVKIGSGGLE